MNISYKWLREYVDTTLNAHEVADALTSIGLEVDGVEEVQSIKGGLEGLWTAHVLTCEVHPNSDHMHICQVDTGQGEPLQIVCGAPNVAAGQKVIVAVVGTKLYDGDECFTIKRSKLRGVESCGMICAEDEIGVGNDHSGIIVLPQDTPVGIPAAEYYHIESDYVIEVDITPNRADACSHYGVARDLYAWLLQNGYETQLKKPSVDAFQVDDESLPIQVVVENQEACPRYTAVSLTGCEVKESPEWLQDRLRVIGIRPINNIVDITNYIMMAFGTPLHCFDADMVQGHQIVVKTMPEGTPFVTLDGVEHKLSDRDLAICNAQEPMCIAGVFGGKGSGTYETTRDVVLESAYFNPTWIRKSARRHGLSTDASFRFERGVDPNAQIYALKAAALMAKELAGAKVSMQIADTRPQPVEGFSVNLQYAYVDALIGQHIPAETIRSIVTSLEMQIREENADGLSLIVPAYRVDVQRPCDVVEDILRIYGYNNVEIPTQLKSSLVIKGEEDLKHKAENLIGEQLVGCGFNEILNNSLTKGDYYKALNHYHADHLVRIMNPLSSDLNVMRQTLLLGGLEVIAYNLNRQQSTMRLFEYGSVYSRDPQKDGKTLDSYEEHAAYALLMTGSSEKCWRQEARKGSYFQLKGYLELLLKRLGADIYSLDTAPAPSDFFAEGVCYQLPGSGKVLATMGTVSKAMLRMAGIRQPVFAAEISWPVLFEIVKRNKIKYKELPRFPEVRRDLALLVDENVSYADLRKTALKAGRKLIRNVGLFDVYRGEAIPQGKKQYAMSFVLQDPDRTLTDNEVESAMSRILNALTSECGAGLR